MVHCAPAGSAPPEVAREMFKLTPPPATALPEAKLTVACCANTGLAAAPARIRTATMVSLTSELRAGTRTMFIVPLKAHRRLSDWPGLGLTPIWCWNCPVGRNRTE
jgi:hypothetical protein